MSFETRVPHGPAEWEQFYDLPSGVLEAIEKNPSPARIAEVIAQVRDQAVADYVVKGKRSEWSRIAVAQAIDLTRVL